MITLQIAVYTSQREHLKSLHKTNWAINKAAVHFLPPCILYIHWENKHLFIAEPVQGATFQQQNFLPQVYDAQM